MKVVPTKKAVARAAVKHSLREYDRESHILIVDDDSSLLKFFKIHLNKFFSKIIVVDSGKDALLAIQDREINLVLSDIRMPKVDGLQLMSKIRKLHPEIPILLISGEPVTEEMAAIIQTSDGFLAKPFSVDELNNYINRGVDLHLVMKELSTILNNPSKIRTAMSCSGESLRKYVEKDSMPHARTLIDKIKTLSAKA